MENLTSRNGMRSTSPTKKVVFARRAAIAQRAVEVEPGQAGLTTQHIPSPQSGIVKVAIPTVYGKAGRPPTKPQCNLPADYQALRHGLGTYTEDTANKLIDAYYQNAGSSTRACRDVGVKYSSFLKWRETIPHFAEALKEVDEIIKDEAHSQFMERVLTTWEPNPTWKLTYFKKHFPQYTEAKKSAKFVFNITDTLIKPDIIEGEVIPPKQLESSNESGSKQVMDSPANTGEVS